MTYQANTKTSPLTSLTVDNLAMALEVTPVAMFLCDTSGMIRLANDACCALFGHAPRTLVNQPVEALVATKMRDAHVSLRDAFHTYPAKRNMGTGGEILGQAADGTLIPLEIGLEPVLCGQEQMVVATMVDLRGQIAQRERMRQIMDATASLMVLVEPNGRISNVNRAVETILGYKREEVIGQGVELLVPDSARMRHSVFRRNYATGAAALGVQPHRTVDARRKDGSVVPVEINLSQLDDNAFGPVLATIVDLSERIAAERALAARQQELEHLNDNLSRFAYSVSHDLKGPLASLSGLLDLTLEDLEDNELDEVKQNLARARDVAARSIADVDATLSVAVSEITALDLEPVDLAGMIEDLWQDLASDLSTAQLVVSGQAPEAWLTEANTLRTALRNLIGNAVKHRAPERDLVVTIDLQNSAENLMLSVMDNGSGIPEDKRTQIFELFHRFGDKSGSGIGLNIVRRNLQRLGGDITLGFTNETDGQGARFVLTLPHQRKAGT